MTVYARGTALLVPALFLWCAACAGAQSPDEAPSVHIVSERSEACRTLVGEIEAVNLATESEAELADLMERADLAAPGCREAFVHRGMEPGAQLIGRHQGRQLDLYALLIEATLSERFDGRAGYCEIVADTFQLLFDNVTELDTALREETLSERDATTLRDLMDLDLHAIDVLVIASENSCSEAR